MQTSSYNSTSLRRTLMNKKVNTIKTVNLCPNCETGSLHHDVRDVSIEHSNQHAIAYNITGLFCNHCEEIIFDKNTDSAIRYAQVSDAMVIANR
jgi:YgiT-type zinc finger domain-containing protein